MKNYMYTLQDEKSSHATVNIVHNYICILFSYNYICILSRIQVLACYIRRNWGSGMTDFIVLFLQFYKRLVLLKGKNGECLT